MAVNNAKLSGNDLTLRLQKRFKELHPGERFTYRALADDVNKLTCDQSVIIRETYFINLANREGKVTLTRAKLIAQYLNISIEEIDVTNYGRKTCVKNTQKQTEVQKATPDDEVSPHYLAHFFISKNPNINLSNIGIGYVK